jgi:hypothetical protein
MINCGRKIDGLIDERTPRGSGVSEEGSCSEHRINEKTYLRRRIEKVPNVMRKDR